MIIKLTYGELKLLLASDTGRNGGFQNYLRSLSYRVDNESGELDLDLEDLKKIDRYATQYGPGGYQNRIKNIFYRTLKGTLGWTF